MTGCRTFQLLSDNFRQIFDRKLDHRLNLFLFYWNSTRIPKDFSTPEPLKVVFLTVPRPDVYVPSALCPDQAGIERARRWLYLNSLIIYLVVPVQCFHHRIRVYYNQATGDGEGTLTLVNWYDANGTGLFRKPLLPSQKIVYMNLQRRQLRIPVIHVGPLFTVTTTALS